MPAFFEGVRRLAREHAFQVTVVGPDIVEVPRVYDTRGVLEPLASDAGGLTIRPVPLKDPSNYWAGFIEPALDQAIDLAAPDLIWLHDEPNHPTALHLLRRFFFRKTPKIACSVIENRWRRPARMERTLLQLHSRRIDLLLGVASSSIEGLRRAYMPCRIPAAIMYWPVLEPDTVAPAEPRLRRDPGDFWVGFAGRICEEKGWRVLLGALTQLPPPIKVAIAGSGPQTAELLLWAQSPQLKDRLIYFGALDKADLYALFRQLDILVVPSLTTPMWAEQFGAVMAEAMAVGLPVIGSRSGAIPEVLGGAGRFVSEADPLALADAITAWYRNPQKRIAAADAGKRRFEQLFSMRAYARRLAWVFERLCSGRVVRGRDLMWTEPAAPESGSAQPAESTY